MAITQAQLTAGKDNVDRTTYTTASVSPGTNKLDILTVYTQAGSGANQVIPTVTGASMTWILLYTKDQGVHRISVFVASSASPGSGTLSIAFSATQIGAWWVLDEISGTVVSNGGLDGVASWATETNTGSTGLTEVGMNGTEANAGGYAAFAHGANEVTGPEAGWTETSDQANTLPNGALETQFKATIDTTPSATWTTSSIGVMVALELRAAATAVPAVQPYVMAHGDDNADATSYTTLSITPVAKRLYLCAVANTKTTTPDTPTVSGAGLTWTQIATDANTGGGLMRVTFFAATGTSPSAGALTIDFAGATQNGMLYEIVEFRGAETNGGANALGGIAQTAVNHSAAAASLTVTLGAFAHPKNATYCFAGSGGTNTGLNPDSDTNELSTDGHTGPTSRVESQFLPSNDTTIVTTLRSGTDVWVGAAAEIRAQITQASLSTITA